MIKRFFDIFFSTLGLCFFPVFIPIGLIIRSDGGPVFFHQERIGRFGIVFKIIKFRTMITSADKTGLQITASGDSRITRIGKFLRKTKIDELPQLINVFKGDMSIVGPRPEVPKYVAYWREAERNMILSVRPGLTDFASIAYSNEGDILSGATNYEHTYIYEIMPSKIRLYIKYVREQSLITDVKIILKTFQKLMPINVFFHTKLIVGKDNNFFE